LQSNVQNKMSILKRSSERFEWENMERQSRKKKQQIDEEERVQMAQIDWNDFVIVETIDLYDDDLVFPTQNLLQQQQAQQEANESQIGPNLKDDIYKNLIEQHNLQPIQQSVKKEEPKPVAAKPQIQEPGKSITLVEEQRVKCQVCGCSIAIGEYEQHLKLELMDPKYFEIKTQLQERIKNTTGASS
jgi:splicing factor 3A subunit 1